MKWILWALVLAVLGGVVRAMVQSHADGNMERVVADMRERLPMDVAGGLRVTAVDYTDRTLHMSARFAGLHTVDAVQRELAQSSLVRNYCDGGMRAFRDNGIRVQYEVHSQGFGEPEDITRIGASPEDCR